MLSATVADSDELIAVSYTHLPILLFQRNEGMVKGLSQERVRRLFALLKTPALEAVPREWARVLPPDAPLSTYERWAQIFAQLKPDDWPERTDRQSAVPSEPLASVNRDMVDPLHMRAGCFL